MATTGTTVNLRNRLNHGLASQAAANELMDLVPKLAYVNTAASTTVGAISTETAFDKSYTIPAGSLNAGSVVKVRYYGFGVAGSGSDTFAHKLYIGGTGGTAVVTSAAAQLATNATFTGEAEIVVRTAGDSGTAISVGTYKQSSAEGTMTVKDDYVASFTLNTNTTQEIVVSGTWNTTNATSARLDVIRVEVI